MWLNGFSFLVVLAVWFGWCGGAFQVITGTLGIFGVGVFAVPVGLLGAGFQEYVETIPDEVRYVVVVVVVGLTAQT